MIDYIKRFCIAFALAGFIGILFIGTATSFAAETEVPDELMESLIWPTVGEITDTFGTREGQHFGIDIAASEGTPVVSIANGIISKSYYSDSYGHVIFVEHDNGLETVYAHLHNRKVEEGQVVGEGELIGTVGNTGRSSGNHLHFEVHKGKWNVAKSDSIDPFYVLSTEPDAIYAAVGGAIEEEVDWTYQDAVYAMSHQLSERPEGEIEEKPGVEDIDYENVKVETGDSLWTISLEHLVTVEELKEWNDLTEETIYPGEELVVYPNEGQVHIVEAGDTLYSISMDHEVRVEDVMNINQLTSDVILPGTMLKFN
ncbi:M23 family metallopeptidase [Bacillus solitudinis]|uniref:M23 family metallopeptidase n=1 Tax=Bacillus solitudinis TaxID=2014074 RepID=UPI000C24DAA6|nr:M23 family metallopeptidase [Bacillus solitudinis]